MMANLATPGSHPSESEACLPKGTTSCPLCEAESTPLFQCHGYWIRRCNTCDHRFADIEILNDHVEHTYNDAYFFGGGAGYSDYLSEAEILTTHAHQYGTILARYMTPGKVLDIGSAAGFILRGLIDFGWQGRGLEPNARMAKFAVEQLGLTVTSTSLEAFSPDKAYDLVTMIQVIAHIADVRSALQKVADLTACDGYVLIETWNRESWTARVFGKNWHEYSPPSVLHWFTPPGLRQLMVHFGFCEVVVGRPGKWLTGRHAKSLLQHKLEQSRLGRLCRGGVKIIPDGLAIPYPAEDLFWALFRKS